MSKNELTNDAKQTFIALLRKGIQECRDQMALYQQQLMDIEPGYVPDAESVGVNLRKFFEECKPWGRYDQAFKLDTRVFNEFFGNRIFRVHEWKEVADFYKVDGPPRSYIRDSMNNWVRSMLGKDKIVKIDEKGEVWTKKSKGDYSFKWR